MDKGVPIRSLSRGIAVLQAINRGDSLSMMEISKSSNVPYPTACRIVQTLLHEGLLEQEPARKRYRPTVAVLTLARGFHEYCRLVDVARPHMVELTSRMGWPISLSTQVGDKMVIRDSTHALTTMTFNDYSPGYAMPLLECAAGLVWLAHLPAEKRRMMLATLRKAPPGGGHHNLDLLEEGPLTREIVASGFARRRHNDFTRNPGKTSSLAVPLFDGVKLVGALTLAFFSSAVRTLEAEAQLLQPLRQTAIAIGKDLVLAEPDGVKEFARGL
jgi:IclR family transcriptional regulator, mhp operon transcriptional activator